MLVTLSGIVMVVNPQQPEKAAQPILVTLSGIVILVKPVQYQKAQEGIAVTPSGIVMDVASTLFIYNVLFLEPFPIKWFNPAVLHHAAISVIYMS